MLDSLRRWLRGDSQRRLLSGFPDLPRIEKLPRNIAGRLEGEVFARFQEASHFDYVGIAPTKAGEIDVLLLWGEKPRTTRVVAFLPLPLRFQWAVTRGADPESLSVRSSDEDSSTRLLAESGLEKLLKDFMARREGAGVSASHVTVEVPGVDSTRDKPVAQVTAQAAALVVELSLRAQALRLTEAATGT